MEDRSRRIHSRVQSPHRRAENRKIEFALVHESHASRSVQARTRTIRLASIAPRVSRESRTGLLRRHEALQFLEPALHDVRYVEDRLRGVLRKRHGAQLRPGHANRWHRPFFAAVGLCRLSGTIQYPGVA